MPANPPSSCLLKSESFGRIQFISRYSTASSDHIKGVETKLQNSSPFRKKGLKGYKIYSAKRKGPSDKLDFNRISV